MKRTLTLKMLISCTLFIGLLITFAAAQVQQPMHRLGVRDLGKGGEFFDTVTGQEIILRGNTYQRLNWSTTAYGSRYRFHSNFVPNYYNHRKSDIALKTMNYYGYNSVRVFISNNDLSNSAEINASYVDNMVDFLKLAQQHNIYVLIVIPALPPRGPYSHRIELPFERGSYNALVLQEASIRKKADYLYAFVSALKDRGAPLDTIMGYSVENEIGFNFSQYPFYVEKRPGQPDGIRNNGKFIAPNGDTYDMSKDSERERLMNEALIYDVNTLRDSIRSVDPQALVSVSFFNPEHQDKPNARHPLDGPEIKVRPRGVLFDPRSKSDFTDVHIYPGFGWTTDEEMKSYGFQPGTFPAKPIIMGEYGAVSMKYSDPGQGTNTRTINFPKGVNAISALLARTSDAYRFKGWFYYEWDTTKSEYGDGYDIINVIELENEVMGWNGHMNRRIAPLYRYNASIEQDNGPVMSNPVGSLDYVTPTIKGWAGQTGESYIPAYIEVYATDSKGVRSYLGRTIANTLTTSKVCSVLKAINSSGQPLDPCLHGFEFNIPSAIMDGRSYTIDAYAYYSKGSGTGILSGSSKLRGSGKTYKYSIPGVSDGITGLAVRQISGLKSLFKRYLNIG